MNLRSEDIREQVRSASDGTVDWEHRDGIAWITLDRPDKLNAINRAMLRGIAKAISVIDDGEEIRCALIVGAGKTFSAGGDLEEVDAMVRDSPIFDRFLDEWHATFFQVERCRAATVAVVDGVAYAGGFELVHVCDFVIASESARLGDQHAKLGMFPPGGSTQRLVRLIGERRAKWLLISGEPIDARTAAEWGLVTHLAPDGQLRDEAQALAEELAVRSPRATAAIKRALQLGAGLDLPAAFAAERPIALEHMASEDVRHGIESFRSRTAPKFE